MEIQLFEGSLLKKTYKEVTVGEVAREVAISFYMSIGRPIPNYKRLHLDIIPRFSENKVSYSLNLEGKEFLLRVR